MQKKSFQNYLEKRLTKTEIIEIEMQAKREKKVLETSQNDSAHAKTKVYNVF